MQATLPEIIEYPQSIIRTNNECYIADLGVSSLVNVELLMTKLTQLRLNNQIPDMLLFHSYKPSLAMGARKLNQADLLLPLSDFQQKGIEYHKSVRGGGLTYHWPGQLICYPILKLHGKEQNLSDYMFRLEEVGLRTLRSFGITATRRREKTAQIGLWIQNNKIASMGVHVSRWVTSFGFALNLYGDTTPADYIRPCGLDGVKLITVEEITGYRPDRNLTKNMVIKNFKNIFNRDINLNSEPHEFLENIIFSNKN